MNKQIISVVLLFSVLSLAQGQNRYYYPPKEDALLFPHLFPLTSLGTNGYNTLNGMPSEINSLNPASLSYIKNISAGISYQLETEQGESWAGGIGSYKQVTPLPQSAGFVYPVKSFTIGIGMNQVYNKTMAFGNIPVTTVDQPDGTGEYFNPRMKMMITNYSVSLAFNAGKLFTDEDNISFGLRAGYNHISRVQELLHSSIGTNEAYGSASFSAGLVYSTFNYFKAGISFESGISGSNTFSYSYNDEDIDPFSGRPYQYYSVIPESYKIITKTPLKIAADVLFGEENPVSYSASFSYLFWDRITDKFTNEPQAAVSIIFRTSESTSISGGLFYSYCGLKAPYNYYSGKMDALYFTFGLQHRINNFILGISAADSHLSGEEWRKQTVAKFSLGYNFL